ncbi:hypothetical protein SH1V18_17020 [Vallitalea longa]|uniref:DZANK-type domain-containing protein n=1 Tax=Vallitalea longa TaxID=2936439 RepID=A0A9W6DF86_9FIRM|nr:zinc ribbon domain-containing protein [Vallitalea longa]GKX29222.1 hypothetical protein SH1V18_17020 [Vallitalea longa]
MYEKSKFKVIFWVITCIIIAGITGLGVLMGLSSLITERDVMPMMIMGIFLLIIVLVIILAGITVYKDAKKLQLDPWMWILIVMYVPYFIGLIIYLVVRSNEKKRVRCVHCGNPVESDYNICPHCGHELAKVCSNCGKYVNKQFNICPYCGKDL